MPQIVVSIDGKTYRMACAEGEEAHLEGLAAGVDARIQELRGSFGEIGDQRLTVMAAIMASDELADAQGRIRQLESEVETLQARENDAAAGDRRLAEHLVGVSDVVERIAARLEGAGR